MIAFPFCVSIYNDDTYPIYASPSCFTTSTGATRRVAAADIARVIEALDERGAWVEDGKLRYHGDQDPTQRVIESRTFARNIVLLAQFVAAGTE